MLKEYATRSQHVATRLIFCEMEVKQHLCKISIIKLKYNLIKIDWMSIFPTMNANRNT